MSEHNKAGSRAHGGISVKSVELAVAVLLFALGALVVFDSQRLGAKWGDDGPQSGYFPFYIGLIICISSVIVFVQGLLEKPGQRLSIFVEWGAFKQVLSVLLPAAVFVLGMQLFGIYAAGAVYIAVFMVWLGKYGWIKALLIAGGISQVLLVVFEMWFKVPLHKGSLYDLTFIFEAVPEFFRPVALAIARLIAGG
jgi:hypothetical protein